MIPGEFHEGHYRAIEQDFTELYRRIRAVGEAPWVVTAGAGQLGRLQELLMEKMENDAIGGGQFLPGIRHLAQKLTPLPTKCLPVSHSDRALMALGAMKGLKEGEPLFRLRNNVTAAHSLACFFEGLLDHGVTGDIYRTAALSLTRDATATEMVMGRLLTRYQSLRNESYSFTPDALMSMEISADRVPRELILYGFYDLNPLQRRFLRRLSSHSFRLHVFSPASMGSPWSAVYRRSGQFYNEIGMRNAVRSDSLLPLNPFAQMLNSMDRPAGPLLPSSGLTVSAVTGEMGLCRQALSRILRISEGNSVPLREIAVVRRKDEGSSLVRLAHHEGVRVNAPLCACMADLPCGRFVLDILAVIRSGFHHDILRRLLVSGLLLSDCAASVTRLNEVVSRTGIRMGAEQWREWYENDSGPLALLLRRLDGFFRELGGTTFSPRRGLICLKQLYLDLTGNPEDYALGKKLFSPDPFRYEGPIDLQILDETLSLLYRRTGIVLRKADPEGFSVVSPEQARGTLYSHLMVLDLEEGVFPRPSIEDPRLGDQLRERLQLSGRTMLEEEDGFLLHQLGQAAGTGLDLIFREREEDGTEVAPSPFIIPLVRAVSDAGGRKECLRRPPASPLRQLLGGTHPGQMRARAASVRELPGDPDLLRSLEAENIRMTSREFEEFDGILPDPPDIREPVSPTWLEAYVRCPFAFMLEKIWKVPLSVPADVAASPEPLKRGIFLHSAVERIVEEHGFRPAPEQVQSILQAEASSCGLEKMMSAEYLFDAFLQREKRAVIESLRQIRPRTWRFIQKEISLEGKLGDLRIQGRIDLVVEDAHSRKVLLDIKSGKLPSKSGTARGRYFQLPFYYALAAGRWDPEEISSVGYLSISSRAPGGLVEFSSEEMEGMLDITAERAGTLVSMMRRGLFPPVPTRQCSGCQWSSICRTTPGWRIKQKMREDDRMEYFRGLMVK